MFCSETEQGELCRQSYLRLHQKGVEVDLKLVMVNIFIALLKFKVCKLI